MDGFYPALAAGEIKPGTVVIFRYQGPKGAPGMPEVSSRMASIPPNLNIHLLPGKQMLGLFLFLALAVCLNIERNTHTLI